MILNMFCLTKEGWDREGGEDGGVTSNGDGPVFTNLG